MAQHGHRRRVEREADAGGGRQVQVAGDEHPARVPVPDQDDVVLGQLALGVADHAVDPLRDLLRALAVRHRVRPDGPAGVLGADVGGGAALVVAVVPLAEVVAHRVGAQAGEGGGVAGTAARTDPDDRRRAPGSPQRGQ